MKSSHRVAVLMSGILAVAYLSGCASVPRTEALQTTQVASGSVGPPVPARLRKNKRSGAVIVADAAAALRDTGDVLRDIAAAVLPEPVTNSYDGKGFRGWRSWERSVGWTGCTANVPGGSDVQWCSNP